jgi:hypothetical protein
MKLSGERAGIVRPERPLRDEALDVRGHPIVERDGHLAERTPERWMVRGFGEDDAVKPDFEPRAPVPRDLQRDPLEHRRDGQIGVVDHVVDLVE